MFDWIKDALVATWQWFVPFVVIDQYQEAVVLRFGKFHRVLLPGFRWLIPFGIEREIADTVVPRVIDLKSQSLTTSDGVPVVVSGAVTFSIVDIRKALLTVRTVHQAIADSCCGVIGKMVRSTAWSALTTEEFTHELTKACRVYARRYGLEIDRVQLTDLARMRALRLHVDQMNDYRSRGEEE